MSGDSDDQAAGGAGSAPDRPGEGGRRGEDRAAGETSGIRSADDAATEDGERAYRLGLRRFGLGSPTHVGRDVQFGHRFTVVAAPAAAPRPGPVRDEHLVELRRRYVRVPRYDDLRDALASRRLLIVVGPPGSGRTTTALHLLDDLAAGRVSRLAPDTILPELDQALADPGGYVLELTRVHGLSATVADRLADVCTQSDSYLVIVASAEPTGPRAVWSYVRRCENPDPEELLRSHLDDLVGAEDPRAPHRLAATATSEDLWSAVGPRPRPAAVAHLASLLVGLARAEATVDDVRAGCEQFVADAVAEWFAPLREDLHGGRAEQVRRAVAQRVALSVFPHQARSLSADAGDLLADRWQLRTRAHGRPARPTSPAETDDVLLASVGAEVVPEARRYRGSWLTVDTVRFTDERVPRAALEHAWRHEPELRQAMSEWLNELARLGDRTLEIQAGQVVGVLCGVDFTYTFDALVKPNASAVPHRSRSDAQEDDVVVADDDEDSHHLGRRRFAAAALDQAARDPDLTDIVGRLLRRWRRSREVALRWTAAATLGFDLGLAKVEETLEELRILGTPQETSDSPELDADTWELMFVAGESVARLFTHGAERAVVPVLDRWMRHERSSLRLLAVQVVVLLADQSRATVPVGGGRDDADPHADDPRSGWPVLLEVARRDPTLADPLALLLRAAIRSRAGGRTVESVLARWMGTAQRDPDLLAALEDFLPRTVVDGSDRSRLRYIVERRRHDWAEPLPREIAERLLDRATTPRTREVPV